MNYFMSDIHGADEAYFELKNRINFRKNDELYLLGDIFDGNNRNPKACIDILSDVMKNDNIHLILGNHELIHASLYLAEKDRDEEFKKMCNEYLENPLCQGVYLRDYIYNNLSSREKNKYFDYIINTCELTMGITIGKIFFYLVHGSPALCTNEAVWQQDICMTELDLFHNYKNEILSDPSFNSFNITNKSLDKSIIIAGHTPTKYIYTKNNSLFKTAYPEPSVTKYQKIIKYNDKMIIDCGCRGNSIGRVKDGWASNLACVGIDAAGYFVEYLY